MSRLVTRSWPADPAAPGGRAERRSFRYQAFVPDPIAELQLSLPGVKHVGVGSPQLNYSAAAADLGVRWLVLPFLHLTIHGGYTLCRRFEFSEGRHRVPGGKYDRANGPVFGVDLDVGR